MTDPVTGLLSYDLSDEEKRAIRNQNLWGGIMQAGMGLLAAGQPISEAQRAQLIMQSIQPLANVGPQTQAMIQSATREKLNMAAANRLAQKDQAQQQMLQAINAPEFQQQLAQQGINPAQMALIRGAAMSGDFGPALTAVTPKKATEADVKRQAILRATGGNQQLADEIEAGIRKMVVGPDGQPYVVNTASGEVVSGTAGQKPMTNDQATSALYADRMRNSEPIIVKNADAATTLNKAKASIPVVGNYLVSDEFQRYDQARRDFINATLRRESGAVISDAEFDNANKQYFPQPGDSKEVIAQKEKNRRVAIEGISRAAGPSYKPSAGSPMRGQVMDGYRFKGGDPADKNNWEPVR